MIILQDKSIVTIPRKDIFVNLKRISFFFKEIFIKINSSTDILVCDNKTNGVIQIHGYDSTTCEEEKKKAKKN
jgi:hypothetical protein